MTHATSIPLPTYCIVSYWQMSRNHFGPELDSRSCFTAFFVTSLDEPSMRRALYIKEYVYQESSPSVTSETAKINNFKSNKQFSLKVALLAANIAPGFVCAYHAAAWVRIPSTPSTLFQFALLKLLREKDQNKQKIGRDRAIFKNRFVLNFFGAKSPNIWATFVSKFVAERFFKNWPPIKSHFNRPASDCCILDPLTEVQESFHGWKCNKSSSSRSRQKIKK